MGLRLRNKRFENGLTLENVYVKIDYLSGNKQVFIARIAYYVNQENRELGNERLYEKDHTFTPNNADDSQNIFKQCYEDLKLNDPEFADAVDVLEEGQTL